MVQLKSLFFNLAAWAVLGAQASPCNTCTSTNVVQDSSFEADTTPWHVTDGVEIKANAAGAEYAHTSEHYMYAYLDQQEWNERYEFSQQLSGLKPNQPYTLQYFYSMVNDDGLHDGGINIKAYLDNVQVDYNIFFRLELGAWYPQNVVIFPTSSNPVLKLSLGAGGNYFYGAGVLLDDVTLSNYCGRPRVD